MKEYNFIWLIFSDFFRPDYSLYFFDIQKSMAVGQTTASLILADQVIFNEKPSKIH